MAMTEVLLLERVDGLGAEGESAKVRAGYARNFLLPKKLALILTYANRKQIEALQKARAAREGRDLEQAQQLADRLSRASLAIVVKTGENGKMFGAVTAKEICEKLANDGIEVDRKKIHLAAPIREIGRHSVLVKLHKTVELNFQFDVVSENPIG
jgi:large subunit ribosomal protein L9